MAVYGKLTKDEALSISYWNAVDGWGILPSDYPQPYYPDSVCGCRISVTEPTGSGAPPSGIPTLIVSLI